MHFPWGVRSTTRTLLPLRASAATMFTVVVVLPTPPFWLATAMTRVTWDHPYLVAPG